MDEAIRSLLSTTLLAGAAVAVIPVVLLSVLAFVAFPARAWAKALFLLAVLNEIRGLTMVGLVAWPLLHH